MTDRDREILEWALGEADGPSDESLRRRLERDGDALLEAASLRHMFEEMKSLSTEPTGRVAATVRYSIDRRRRLRDPRRGGFSRHLSVMTRVAAVALATMLGLSWNDGVAEPAGGGAEVRVDRQRPVSARLSSPLAARVDEVDDGLLEQVLLAGGADLERHYLALREPTRLDSLTGQLRASNELAMLRLEFTQRYSRRARRASIARCGVKPNLEDRIQALAGSVAGAVQVEIDRDVATVEGTALALRALLAAGSTMRLGHREAVGSAVAFLEERIPELNGGSLATALAGLTDFAVVTGGDAASVVAVHGQRLAESVHQLPETRPSHSAAESGASEHRRPELIGFRTPAACLADAGHVLRLAPAFGVDPMQAHDARLLMAAHLEERLEEASGERPEVLAAMLYGFSDLIDRRRFDHGLLLWRPVLLAGHDLVALHHVSWSQFPPRPGWATFQRELRELATIKTPERIRDTSALLLSLAMNYAAPGVHQVLHLTG